MVAASGVNGLAWDGNEFDDSEKNLTRAWLRTKGNSIEGGTSFYRITLCSKPSSCKILFTIIKLISIPCKSVNSRGCNHKLMPSFVMFSSIVLKH